MECNAPNYCMDKILSGITEEKLSLSQHFEKRKPEYQEIDGLLFNFRDLSKVVGIESNPSSDHILKRGRVYRSACISRRNLNEDESKKVIDFLQNKIKVKTIIDLRSHDEIPFIAPEVLLHKEYTMSAKSCLPSNHSIRRVSVPLLKLSFKDYFGVLLF